MAEKEKTASGKGGALQWQDGTGYCLWCRTPFGYLITSSGPWAIDRSDVTCAECDARMRIEVVHTPVEGTAVRTKPVEPGRAGLVERRKAPDGRVQDFINKHSMHNGDAIEQWRGGRKWVSGSYHWSGDENDAAEFFGDDNPVPMVIDGTRVYRSLLTR